MRFLNETFSWEFLDQFFTIYFMFFCFFKNDSVLANVQVVVFRTDESLCSGMLKFEFQMVEQKLYFEFFIFLEGFPFLIFLGLNKNCFLFKASFIVITGFKSL